MTNTRTRVEPLHCPEGAGSTLYPLQIVDHRIGDEARALVQPLPTGLEDLS